MAAVSAEQERTADLRSKESEVSSSSGLEAGGKQGDTADTEAGEEEPAPAPATPLDCSVSPPPALAAVDSLQESVAKVSPCSAAVAGHLHLAAAVHELQVGSRHPLLPAAQHPQPEAAAAELLVPAAGALPGAAPRHVSRGGGHARP